MHIKRENNCIICKGSNPSKYCGRTFCPIYAKSEALFKVENKIDKDYYFGSSPNVFVGKHGWPDVNVGILTPPEIKEDAWLYDAPRHWASKDLKIQPIINYRSTLVNSRFKSSVFVNNNKFLELSQEVGLSSKPVDVEINLESKPSFKIKYDSDILPMGANAQLKKAVITQNPHIDRKVDKVFSDTDLKANDAMKYLYQNEFDENFLSKMLSIGTIGIKKKRTLVPTRWAITAVDDNIGKQLIAEIKEFNESDYFSFFGGYLGNYYLVMFFPDVWSYELFESYLPKASWNQSETFDFVTDNETYKGRTDYAQNTAGGYYAARLPILEKLKSIKRQASVLALRFVTDEYEVPLGVWVVREATRKAMLSRPLNFGSKELMIKYAKLIIQKKFGVDIEFILKQSALLKQINTQQKLNDFF
jgi:DNA repair protein NreA